MTSLIKLETLKKHRLVSQSEEIGAIRRVYFDDDAWAVRYFVVTAGSWFTGRDVLVHPAGVDSLNALERVVELNITREQIANCPPLTQASSISRQYEEKYFQHYDWIPYWSAGFGVPAPTKQPASDAPPDRNIEATHLRSSAEVLSYRIDTPDGRLGRASDLVLDQQDWAIRYLEIDTSTLWPGKHILLAPAWIKEISWSARTVRLELSKRALEEAPEYRSGEPIDREYELALFKHYGKPRYWQD